MWCWWIPAIMELAWWWLIFLGWIWLVRKLLMKARRRVTNWCDKYWFATQGYGRCLLIGDGFLLRSFWLRTRNNACPADIIVECWRFNSPVVLSLPLLLLTLFLGLEILIAYSQTPRWRHLPLGNLSACLAPMSSLIWICSQPDGPIGWGVQPRRSIWMGRG